MFHFFNLSGISAGASVELLGSVKSLLQMNLPTPVDDGKVYFFLGSG